VFSVKKSGGDIAVELNPCHPRLKVLSAVLQTILYDEEVGDGTPGSGHLHPTIATVDDRLYYAWSRRPSEKPPAPPQVVLAVYALER
jgi:hypothetical protein